MKAFSGGQLLDEKSSPFGKALTKSQCIQYALDKPGVLTVLPGIRNKQDIEDILSFLKASAEEKDYSVLGSFTPADTEGKCVYCHHCQPCPVGLDIGLINKYYDLAKAGDTVCRSARIGHSRPPFSPASDSGLPPKCPLPWSGRNTC